MENGKRPATPVVAFNGVGELKSPEEFNGLTKREYFAGQVLNGLMVQSIPGTHNQNSESWNKERAKFCVDMADELLKALGNENN